jgi:hypothetical protein
VFVIRMNTKTWSMVLHVPCETTTLATVLSCLSDLRADHPYLINIEHMYLGMMSPEKDDDPKFIRYHNRSVGEDESGIDVRRSLKAYSA